MKWGNITGNCFVVLKECGFIWNSGSLVRQPLLLAANNVHWVISPRFSLYSYCFLRHIRSPGTPASDSKILNTSNSPLFPAANNLPFFVFFIALGGDFTFVGRGSIFKRIVSLHLLCRLLKRNFIFIFESHREYDNHLLNYMHLFLNPGESLYSPTR